MNRKDFFKKLGLGAAVVAVAPQVLAETPEEITPYDKESVKKYVNSIDFLDKREIIQPFNDRAIVEEVLYKKSHVAEIICDNDFFRTGDVVALYREGHKVGLQCLVTSVSIFSAQRPYKRIKIIPAFEGGFDVKKGDVVKCLANAYAEK